eukprot:CAMPEP_0116143122 /NCGR_PEP_ID=MMETSP0329-20121206/15280_1 /TAXON_ID=697910 /ORGANISM="Pseudo-nitzschia arenysensis, Strain B593" /LENGTH=541 /DNA_ID=CAMNT_0003638417 /DNA_START=117 /DNA_END=1742 /DNA_ORIENTATION=+
MAEQQELPTNESVQEQTPAEANPPPDEPKKTPKKPKNLQQGLMFGASNILGGAVGGLGVAIAAPVAGARAGAQKAGFVGGTVGLVGGAAMGVIGGAGILVGGAVKGAIDIKRGVEAVPASISAPKQGKWWNETTSTWMYTNLEETDIPENDDDILEGLENDLDSTDLAPHAASGNVKDTYYYEALGVETNADAHRIKRQYYLAARKYHPDKNPGDDEAAEKFKLCAEAYQVLSDPELRAKYDKGGRDVLSGDKTSATDFEKPDPSLLLAFLFGSDRFNSYVGRLATSTSALLGDNTKVSAKDARTLQERRCARLALTLVMRINPWVDMNFKETEDTWKIQAEELKKASYGWELVKVIGLAYELAATQFLGNKDSGIGLPSITKWAGGRVASVRKAAQNNKNKWETQTAQMDIVMVQAQYQKMIENATSDIERLKLQREMETTAANVMMKMIWHTTSVDITSTIHETCQMVFFDQSVDKKIRQMRGKAVKRLGKIFQECTPPETRVEGGRTDAKVLFEEAAMAATMETMRRKETSTNNATSS